MRKTYSDKDTAEPFKSISESARLVPIPCANVAPVVGGDATAVNDDAENDKAGASEEFDHRENELHCTCQPDILAGTGHDLPSPYPRTPKICMMDKATRKTAIHTPILMSSRQNRMVTPAAVISKGSMVSHWMA